MTTAIERPSMNHRSTGLKDKILEFLNDKDQVERLRQKTEFLSTGEKLVQAIQELTPEDRVRFVEKLDEVCHSACFLFVLSQRFLSAQLYPTLNVQDAVFLNAFGEVCSASGKLPTSVVISTGLEKNGTAPIASGGLMDVWLGEHNGEPVIIKVFRVYPGKAMSDVEEVRIEHEHVKKTTL